MKAYNRRPLVDVSSTAYCELCSAQRRRVESLVLEGRFLGIASTPCSCVGVGGQHSGIFVVLLKSSRQCSLYYLLLTSTYLLWS